MNETTRRRFLQTAVVGTATLSNMSVPGPLAWSAEGTPAPKVPIAAIVTTYYTNSHADVLVGKVLEGWQQTGGEGPNLKLVSLYVDQRGSNDLSANLAKKHGFLTAKTIDEALTLGTDKLAVGGVLIVGEHGDYPEDPHTKQVHYPRKKFFQEVAAAFRRLGQVAPVFNDKHLSAYWDDARQMYDTAAELKIPMMAGSSVPVAWRNPSETIPIGSDITEGIMLGYGGLEAYGFHAVEGLQCLMERRAGGETGVKSVQAVQGDGIWQAEKEGRWSKALFDSLVAHAPKPGGVRPAEMAKDAVFYLIEYSDGTKGTVAMGTGYSHEFCCGLSIRGRQPFTVTYLLQDGPPYGHFEQLLRAVDHMFQTGKPAYPLERTLLTTGVLDAALHSWSDKGRRMETPQLQLRYAPADWPFAKGEVPAANVVN